MNKMYKYAAAIALMMVSINFASAQQIGKAYHAVVSVVKETRLLVEQDAQKAFKSINETGLTEPYPFVLDLNLVVVAHGFMPERVGTSNIGTKDSNGKDYTAVMLSKALENGKGWVDYRYVDPATGKEGNKVSYFELVKGSDGSKYIVGSGAYSD